MALRCPRCQKNEMALETFGVYRCPACGRVDADGNLLDLAAPPTLEGAAPPERVSFAAPPPMAWTPPSGPARPALTEVADANGPPTLLYGGIALMFFVSLAGALTSGAWLGAVLRWATLAALWTGRPWARTLSIVGSGISIIAVVVAMSILRGHVPQSFTVIAVLAVVTDIAWLYVMFRADTVRHFLRRA